MIDPQKAAYDQGYADAIERIATELERMADDYLATPDTHEPWDVWKFCAWLATQIRAGRLTKPLSSEPPF